MSPKVFFAPIGASITDEAAWTSVPVTAVQWFTSEDMADVAGDLDLSSFAATSSLNLSFTTTRREMRRIKRLIPRSKDDLRRSAMRTAYHRRRGIR